MSENILSRAIPNKFMNRCGELSGAKVVGGVKNAGCLLGDPLGREACGYKYGYRCCK